MDKIKIVVPSIEELVMSAINDIKMNEETLEFLRTKYTEDSYLIVKQKENIRLLKNLLNNHKHILRDSKLSQLGIK